MPRRRGPTPPLPAVTASQDLQWAVIRRIAIGSQKAEIAQAYEITVEQVEDVLALPINQKRIKQRLQMLLLTEHAPRAIQILSELAENPETPAFVRRLAASDILSRSGFGPASAGTPETYMPPTKSAAELTTDELRAMIDGLQGEIADRSCDVSRLSSQSGSGAMRAPQWLD